MRPRIVDFFDKYFSTGIFHYIIPDPAVIYAITLGLGLLLFIRRCNIRSLDIRHSTGIALWTTISGMIGARLFFLMQNIGYTFHNPSILLEINGATVSFGVYLGGIAGFLGYCRIQKVVPWEYMDTAVSVLGIGPMIGRLACFLNGDDYGSLSNLPWSVRYPHGSYPFLDHVEKGLINPMADLSLSVHPVQLYGCLKGLILFIIFSYLWRKRFFKPGGLFPLFFISYSLLRFILEFFRGDEDRGWVGVLSTGQFASLVIIALSIPCLFYFIRKKESPMSLS